MLPVQTNKLATDGPRTKRPPGPRSLNPLSDTLAFRHAPLAFLTTMSQQYGDIWQFRLLKWPTVVLNQPNYLKHILQEKNQRYDKKVRLFDISRPLVGNGLVTNADAEHWVHQRRLIQPTFHRQRLAGFATIMVQRTLESLQRWESLCSEDQPLCVIEEMRRLVLGIMGETLFSTDISEHNSIIGQGLTAFITYLNNAMSLPFPPLSVPTPENQRLKRAIRGLDQVVYDLIHQQSENQKEDANVLSILLHARDEQTGESMSHQQVRDEVMALLIGGSESSTNSLAWLWYVLGQHPQVEEALHEELERVLGGRTPTVNDLGQLIYTRMIIDEVLRLYPAAWLLMRRAAQDDEIGGYIIPKNTFMLWSTYVLHRHRAIWDEPEQFRPERFELSQAEKRPRFSYLPFGGGPRMCIGNQFALMEMTLVVATVAQRYRLELLPEQMIKPEALAALRPNKEILVYLRPRR